MSTSEVATAPAAAAANADDKIEEEKKKKKNENDGESLLDVMGHLTPEQEKLAGELRSKLDALIASGDINMILAPSAQREYRDYPKVFLVRHLISRKWVVSTTDGDGGALEMILFASKWRIEKKIDSAPLFPPPANAGFHVQGYDIARLVEQRNCGRFPSGDDNQRQVDEAFRMMKFAHAQGYHKHDKRGRVVFVDRLGHMRPNELFANLRALTPPGPPENMHDLAIRMRTYSNEVGGELVRYRNAENRKLGLPASASVVAVTDCDGISMEFLSGLDILKAQGEHDRLRMSEGIAAVLMVNAGIVVRSLWNIVKVFVDERTRSKFVFAAPGEETQKLLRAYIDEENVPDFLGGKCRCEGGCIPDVADRPATTATARANDGKTVEIVVKAGSCEDMCIESPTTPGKKKKVQWSLLLAERDINFSIGFEAKGDEKKEIRAVEKVGASTSGRADAVYSGEFDLAPEEEGTIRFRFGNEYSWMRSKTVQFRASLVQNGGDDDDGKSSAAAAAAPAAVVEEKVVDEQAVGENKDE